MPQKPGDAVTLERGEGYLRLKAAKDAREYRLFYLGEGVYNILPGEIHMTVDRDAKGSVTGLSSQPNRLGLTFTIRKTAREGANP
jgi:hypothetical protein